MSSPRTVKQVAKETGWLNEKFLKHLAKNYSGKEFTLDSLREDPVISKFLDPPAPKKKATKAPKKTTRAVAPSPMKFLKENPDTVLTFNQENPKKAGSQSYTLYEKYKAAKTYAEFKSLGGENNFLLWDYRKGFLHIEGADIENFTPAPKKTKASTGATPKKSTKKKTEKKEKEKVEEKVADPAPVSEELEQDETPSDETIKAPSPAENTDTPVESKDSEDSEDESDDEGGFNPFNITGDDSDDGEESD
jgi:hypothetical protein